MKINKDKVIDFNWDDIEGEERTVNKKTNKSNTNSKENKIPNKRLQNEKIENKKIENERLQNERFQYERNKENIKNNNNNEERTERTERIIRNNNIKNLNRLNREREIFTEDIPENLNRESRPPQRKKKPSNRKPQKKSSKFPKFGFFVLLIVIALSSFTLFKFLKSKVGKEKLDSNVNEEILDSFETRGSDFFIDGDMDQIARPYKKPENDILAGEKSELKSDDEIYNDIDVTLEEHSEKITEKIEEILTGSASDIVNNDFSEINNEIDRDLEVKVAKSTDTDEVSDKKTKEKITDENKKDNIKQEEKKQTDIKKEEIKREEIKKEETKKEKIAENQPEKREVKVKKNEEGPTPFEDSSENIIVNKNNSRNNISNFEETPPKPKPKLKENDQQVVPTDNRERSNKEIGSGQEINGLKEVEGIFEPNLFDS